MKRFRNISTALTLVLAISFLIICLLFSFSLSHLYGELSRQRQHELSQAAAQAAANHTSTLYRQAKALVSSCANAPKMVSTNSLLPMEVMLAVRNCVSMP